MDLRPQKFGRVVTFFILHVLLIILFAGDSLRLGLRLPRAAVPGKTVRPLHAELGPGRQRLPRRQRQPARRLGPGLEAGGSAQQRCQELLQRQALRLHAGGGLPRLDQLHHGGQRAPGLPPWDEQPHPGRGAEGQVLLI